jgi:hypothetical protein
MHWNFDVNILSYPQASFLSQPSSEATDLLRQILETQREQLTYLRATAAAHDVSSRWRAFLARCRDEYPDLTDACRKALPMLERSYGSIIVDLSDELRQNGQDALDSEFALQDFLDRYGMRLGQLGNLLNVVGPLAEVGAPKDSP